MVVLKKIFRTILCRKRTIILSIVFVILFKAIISLSQSTPTINLNIEDNLSVKNIVEPNSSDKDLSVYIIKPITSVKVLPDTLPSDFPLVGEASNNAISISACRGEFEPASFVIRAAKDLSKTNIEVSDLTDSNGNTIGNSAVDIRVVKCWYQAGNEIDQIDKRTLVPELLLKDDQLVRVDYETNQNYLRDINNKYVLISGKENIDISHIYPQDSQKLQVVEIEKNLNKQFWITIKVPDDCIPAVYLGKIKLTAANAINREINLKLTVLPYQLAKPVLKYAIYYMGMLTNNSLHDQASSEKMALLNHKWKTSTQYYSEMMDLKSHGIDYPTISQKDDKLIQQELKIRDKVGMSKEAYLNLSFTTYNPTKGKDIRTKKKQVMSLLRLTREHGYKEIYIYGIDEAKGEELSSQRPAWSAVHEVGAKVYAAIKKGNFALMGDILDLAVLSSTLDPIEAEKYHKAGQQVFSYANPQVGVENPEIYRRNFGLFLWKAGYDGAMNYAYQAAFQNIWNDFDHEKYRDHVFAYPIGNGVIDTIQWEGFREGVDDIRYLSTLIESINAAKKKTPVLAFNAEEWVKNMGLQSDLYLWRSDVNEWILKLMRH